MSPTLPRDDHRWEERFGSENITVESIQIFSGYEPCTFHLCLFYCSLCNPTVFVRVCFTPQFAIHYKSSHSFAKHCLWTRLSQRQCAIVISTTLVWTVMGSRSIHKNFLRPLFGLFSCPLPESPFAVSTRVLFLYTWRVRYLRMHIFTSFWTVSPVHPRFETHLLWSRWCLFHGFYGVHSVNPGGLQGSLMSFSYRLLCRGNLTFPPLHFSRYDVSPRSHMSSHLVYQDTYGLCFGQKNPKCVYKREREREREKKQRENIFFKKKWTPAKY